jgi:hypothetical protein
MNQQILVIFFFLTFQAKAQQYETWRLSSNLFLSGVFTDNTEGVHKPKLSAYSTKPDIGYGLCGEALFKVTRKIKLSMGLGFDFRNFSNQIDNYFLKDNNGKPIYLASSTMLIKCL